METFKTLEAARANKVGVESIAEIDHAAEGRCYIRLKCHIDIFRNAISRKPMAEIKAVIAGHPLLSPAEEAALRSEHLRTKCRCERCRTHVDGNTAYSQQEWFQRMRVTAFYCESCRTLLAGIGAGEYTQLQERASARPGYEPEHKEDF